MHLIHLIKSTVLASVFVIMPLSGCETVPATGERQLNFLTQSEEIAIGEEAAPQFREEYGGQLDIPQVNEYVSQLGQRMAAESERPDLPWEFTVLDSEQINAFALPGGKVFITRGLISKFDNEAQLAGVLAHEIGHVTGLHINQQMSRSMLLQAGLSAAGAATESQWVEVIGGVGGQVYMLSFSRDQESEADELGLRYMTNLGYDPRGMLQVLQVLKEAGGSAGGIEFLQTHPLPQTRIERVERLVSREYAFAVDSPDYVLGREAYQQNVLQPLAAQQ
ncbi:MAG: M48 family metallopeptidase [Phycisphaeraceae bacterium]